jgi:hypothetical protein
VTAAGAVNNLFAPGSGMGTVLLAKNSQLWEPLFDLNELVWNYWNSASLSDGPVSSWTDVAGGFVASQATGANQPTKSAASGGVVFTQGVNQFLTFAGDGSAIRHYRTVCLLFQANVAAAPATDGSLVHVNGSANLPVLLYNGGVTNTFEVQWNNDSNYAMSVANPADNVWHCLICRRVNGVAYTSIDGGTEVASIGNNLVLNVASAASQIGDIRTNSIGWICKSLMFLQGELTTAQLQSLQGWAMWSMGVQGNLPGGHPYASAAPLTAPFVNPWTENNDATWTNIITPNGIDATQRGTALDLTGLTQIWRVDFNSTSDIADEITGPLPTPGAGPLYAPVQVSAGIGVEQRPASLPSVMSVSGGTAIINVTYQSPNWYTTNLCSVNLDGRGTTFNPKLGPIYFEASIKADITQLGPLYISFWFKDATEFLYSTMQRIEIDVIEAYFDYTSPTGTSNFQSHCTYHNWSPSRPYDSRMVHDYTLGHITTLNPTAAPGWPTTTNLFDGNFHTYGAMLNATNLIYYVDRFEVQRQPLYADMNRPMWTLLSAQVWEDTAETTTPTEITDYVQVLQGTY